MGCGRLVSPEIAFALATVFLLAGTFALLWVCD